MSNSLVLLPTYNERENLSRVLPRLAALNEAVDVLVIDDASPDGTGTCAEELRKTYPWLLVLHRRAKEGLGRAYVHGFRVAIQEGYRRIVTMDADLSHAPEDVPRLLGALEEADVAIGSRHAPGGGVEEWPFQRRLLSRAGSLYARTLLHLPVSDVTGGFRAYRTETLRELDLEEIHATGFIFQAEILRYILDLPGARAVEVPIVFRNRARGSSKLSQAIVYEAAWGVAKLAFRKKKVPERRYEPLSGEGTFEPRVTVVVPAPDGVKPEAIKHLEFLRYPGEKLEVVVARGHSPARQRNHAVEATSGEFILFLDEDSRPSPEVLRAYLSVFERDPTVAAVGGPAESLQGNALQDLAALILGEPWVVGKTASRYRARGRQRFTDERELILCNLCVRRQAFEALGGFEETLYPSEENEFLERLRLRGWRLVYRPEALVRRPQRENLRELLAAVMGYGRGRAAQLRCLPSRVSVGRTTWVGLALLLGVGSVVGILRSAPILTIPMSFYICYLAFLGLRLSGRAGLRKGLWGAGLAALIHGSYAIGLLWGIVKGPPRREAGEVRLERWGFPGDAPGGRRCA